MNKERAIQTIAGIYNMLQTIPVSGEQPISIMAGVFQGLKELGQWVNEIKEDGENEDETSN